MKIAVVLSAAIISLSSAPVLAQQANAAAQTTTNVNAGDAHVSQSTAANASADRSGSAIGSDTQSSAQVQTHPVNGELVGKLDSKTAKAGDPVVVKTTQAFRTSEGFVIPKGSRLVGHVTDVQAHGKGSQDARLGIQFDRAELKSGESFRVRSTIESVAPPANAMTAAAMASSEDSGAMAGGGRAMGGGRASGSLLGGGASGVSSATAGVGTSLGRTVGGSAGAANGLTSSAGASLGNNVSGTARAAGGLEAHATAIPGVMLQGSAAGSASGVLSASKHNVHLESGTQMTLGISGALGR